MQGPSTRLSHRSSREWVQFALWSFCAEARHDICNGRQIDDRQPCQRTDCPWRHVVAGSYCARRLEVKQEIYRR